MNREPWEQLVEEEASALVKLIETPTRKAMVIVMTSDADGMASVYHAASDDCSARNVHAFIQCIDRRRAWLAARLVKSEP